MFLIQTTFITSKTLSTAIKIKTRNRLLSQKTISPANGKVSALTAPSRGQDELATL